MRVNTRGRISCTRRIDTQYRQLSIVACVSVRVRACERVWVCGCARDSRPWTHTSFADVMWTSRRGPRSFSEFICSSYRAWACENEHHMMMETGRVKTRLCIKSECARDATIKSAPKVCAIDGSTLRILQTTTRAHRHTRHTQRSQSYKEAV